MLVVTHARRIRYTGEPFRDAIAHRIFREITGIQNFFLILLKLPNLQRRPICVNLEKKQNKTVENHETEKEKPDTEKKEEPDKQNDKENETEEKKDEKTTEKDEKAEDKKEEKKDDQADKEEKEEKKDEKQEEKVVIDESAIAPMFYG